MPAQPSRRQRSLEDRNDPGYRSKTDRRTTTDHFLANVVWPTIRRTRDVARPLTWEKFFRTVQIAAAVAGIMLLLVEGFYAAAYNERIARKTDEIEFPLQGLQAAASVDDLVAVSSSSEMLAGRVPVRNVIVDDVSLHPVGAVLVNVIRTHDIHSMIDWPCREHREIVPSALRLAMNITSTKEVDEGAFHYFCIDMDSDELATSRSAVRDAVGSRRGLNFILQESKGSFRLSKKLTPVLKTDTRNIAAPRRSQGRSVDVANSRTPKPKKDSPSNMPAIRAKSGRPELVFSWGGRIGGPASSTDVKELVISAAASGASFALIGAHAAYGTRWERPNATMASIDDLTTGRLNGDKMPWFPFGNAVVSVTADYSPTSGSDGRSDPKFLVLYRLDAVPSAIVKTQMAEYSDDISLLDVPDKDS